MRNLIVYDRYTTHTNAVFEHLDAFRRYSVNEHHYLPSSANGTGIDWGVYDSIIVHYSARLVTGGISSKLNACIEAFTGNKVLFVQDEYDLTDVLRSLIRRLGFQLVFTCVPAGSVSEIYPVADFPGVRFVSNLTGYAPSPTDRPQWPPLADRPIHVGYRGRALPYWYGNLGQEKQQIAERFKDIVKDLPTDIEWDDDHRLYGDAWSVFLARCRATLGTESGSNIFDNDGSIRSRFEHYLARNPGACYRDARQAVLGNDAEPQLMNQVSPRIFEAINSGTALVLYEGSYSGVVAPNKHYIPLRKDFSNIDDVLRKLADLAGLSAMVERAWRDVIGSGRWSYQSFIAGYDQELKRTFGDPVARRWRRSDLVTDAPIRSENVRLSKGLASIWRALPLSFRSWIYPLAHSSMATLANMTRRNQRK